MSEHGRNNSGVVSAYHDQNVRDDDPMTTVSDATDDDRFRQIQEWWRQARESQAGNRYEMSVDEDFYDSIQLSDDERLELQERGQAPIIKNIIAQPVDWILGTEKRTRMEAKAYPRQGSDEANESALNKTKLLKYVDDVSKGPFASSRAFKDAVVVGVGWLEEAVRNDETEEALFSRYESWRHIWYDHLSHERDLSDSRYLFRQKWIDTDIAEAMFPDKKAEIYQSSISHNVLQDSDDDEFYSMAQVYQSHDSNGFSVRHSSSGESWNVNNRRSRVKLVECWYRVPVAAKKIRGFETDLNGRVFDPSDEKQQAMLSEEVISIYDAIVMEVRCCIFTDHYSLEDKTSPYKHDRFPFVPIWGKRRGRDNAPYGMVRSMRDAQRDYNARSSKALYILSTNQIIAESDAVEDWEEIRAQAAAPDGIMRLVSGAGAQNKRFEVINDKALAEEHIMLMNQDQEFLMRSSGVTDENLGQATNAQSGKAILAKQTEGAVTTFLYFDNLRFARQLVGEIRLSNIEKFMDMPMSVRITGDNNEHDFVSLNQPEFDPETGQIKITNDITEFSADFKIDTEDFRQSVRQAQEEAMFDMLTRMPPELAIQLMDLVVDMSDIVNKDEWVKRIQSMNGHRSPDEQESPEEMQEREQAEAQEAQQAQMEQEAQQAEMEKAKAEAAKLSADAAKITADAKRIAAETVLTNIQAIGESTEAAATAVTLTGVIPIADQLLDSAGFVDQGSMESIETPNLPPPTVDKKVVEQVRDHKNPMPREAEIVKPEKKTNE